MPLLTSRISRSRGRRVAFLDDALDLPVGVADDAAVAVRIGQFHRQHGRRRLRLAGDARAAARSVAALQQRHVARRAAAPCRTALPAPAPPAAARGRCRAAATAPTNCSAGRAASAARTSSAPWPTTTTCRRRASSSTVRRTCSMSGRPASGVQHFRARRLHSRALAGREDDDVKGHRPTTNLQYRPQQVQGSGSTFTVQGSRVLFRVPNRNVNPVNLNAER